MRAAPAGAVGRGVELLGRDLAQRLGKPEADAPVAGLDPVRQRDVEQGDEGLEDVEAVAAGDRLELLQLDRPGERAQAGEQRLRGGIEQAEGPVDGGAQER